MIEPAETKKSMTSTNVANTFRHPEPPRRAPTLLTPGEVAALLRTSKKAIYAMVERGQLPGIVRIGRRLLVREDHLLEWLRQKSTPSLRK